ISQALLKALNALPFYEKPFPKSLGFEWVKTEVIPLIDAFQLSIKDVLRTFVEHVAMQISKEIGFKKGASVLVTGGGAYNVFLMGRIRHLTTSKIVVPESAIVEFKEALIFGLLGVLR